MTKITKLKRAVNRLIKAEVEDSWKGGGDPDDIPAIEFDLHLARMRYREALLEIEHLIGEEP